MCQPVGPRSGPVGARGPPGAQPVGRVKSRRGRAPVPTSSGNLAINVPDRRLRPGPVTSTHVRQTHGPGGIHGAHHAPGAAHQPSKAEDGAVTPHSDNCSILKSAWGSGPKIAPVISAPARTHGVIGAGGVPTAPRVPGARRPRLAHGSATPTPSVDSQRLNALVQGWIPGPVAFSSVTPSGRGVSGDLGTHAAVFVTRNEVGLANRPTPSATAGSRRRTGDVAVEPAQIFPCYTTGADTVRGLLAPSVCAKFQARGIALGRAT